jgi:hypothetical protein
MAAGARPARPVGAGDPPTKLRGRRVVTNSQASSRKIAGEYIPAGEQRNLQ